MSALKDKFSCLLSISRLTAGVGLAIVLAASFMRQAYNFVKSIVPLEVLSLGVWLGFIALLGSALFLISYRPRLKSLMALLMVAALGVSLALSMDLMEERVHILTYGFLGFLAMRDLKEWPTVPRMTNSLIFCVMVGCTDELFQALLPYRIGDIRDIFFDSMSALLGVVMTMALPEGEKGQTFS